MRKLPDGCARQWLGQCPVIARTFHRLLRGRIPEIAAALPTDNRRIVGVSSGLILIRGWCLTKMTGFPIPESRPRFSSIEHSKLTQ